MNTHGNGIKMDIQIGVGEKLEYYTKNKFHHSKWLGTIFISCAFPHKGYGRWYMGT